MLNHTKIYPASNLIKAFCSNDKISIKLFRIIILHGQMPKKSLFIFIFILLSCRQEPAKFLYKGQYSYGQNSSSLLSSRQKTLNADFKGKNFVLVKTGDSLYKIAKKNKVALRSLIEANRLEPPYILFPGDKIIIPQQRRTHLVNNGESLSIIAQQYQTSQSELVLLNNLEPPYLLYPGQILVLPYQSQPATSQLAKKTAPKGSQKPAKNQTKTSKQCAINKKKKNKIEKKKKKNTPK